MNADTIDIAFIDATLGFHQAADSIIEQFRVFVRNFASFVLIYVDRDAFLLFVCLFVCYLFPLAVLNCLTFLCKKPC